MPIVPTFARLYHGRLWHIARPHLEYAAAEEDSIGAAWCGESWPTHGERAAERLEGVVPMSGAMCQRCVAAVTRYRLAIMSMARVRALSTGEPLPDAAAEDDWPCGMCGHPNLDHDIDTGRCTITDDSPDVDWAECPCRGLQPEC